MFINGEVVMEIEGSPAEHFIYDQLIELITKIGQGKISQEEAEKQAYFLAHIQTYITDK